MSHFCSLGMSWGFSVACIPTAARGFNGDRSPQVLFPCDVVLETWNTVSFFWLFCFLRTVNQYDLDSPLCRTLRIKKHRQSQLVMLSEGIDSLTLSEVHVCAYMPVPGGIKSPLFQRYPKYSESNLDSQADIALLQPKNRSTQHGR